MKPRNSPRATEDPTIQRLSGLCIRLCLSRPASRSGCPDVKAGEEGFDRDRRRRVRPGVGDEVQQRVLWLASSASMVSLMTAIPLID